MKKLKLNKILQQWFQILNVYESSKDIIVVLIKKYFGMKLLVNEKNIRYIRLMLIFAGIAPKKVSGGKEEFST